MEKANFLRGSGVLRSAGKMLENAKFEEPFPPSSRARLVRKGILSCSSYTGCNFVFCPPSGRENKLILPKRPHRPATKFRRNPFKH